MERIEGVITDIIIPFDRKGKIDRGALEEMTDFLIESGVHGIIAPLTIGEFTCLSLKERNQVVKIIVRQAKGKISVYAGTGMPSTKDTIYLSRSAEDEGVSAIMVITPYYLKPCADDMVRHYEEIGKAVRIPLIPYNNPARTGIHLSIDVCCRLAKIKNVVGIKDSSADLLHFGELVRILGNKLTILMGRDDLILAGLALGASGTVNAVGNIIPQTLIDLYNAVKNGDYERARRLQYETVTPLFKELVSIGTLPAAIKEAVKLQGRKGGYPRSPVFPLSSKQVSKIKAALKNLKII